jgi:ribosomal protein S17
MPNIIIVEYHEERRLELTQFFENSYAGIFHIATFSNIVQALLHVNQDTSIFIYDCHYFDKASTKILRFVKNRNKKTLVISRFDTKKNSGYHRWCTKEEISSHDRKNNNTNGNRCLWTPTSRLPFPFFKIAPQRTQELPISDRTATHRNNPISD